MLLENKKEAKKMEFIELEDQNRENLKSVINEYQNIIQSDSEIEYPFNKEECIINQFETVDELNEYLTELKNVNLEDDYYTLVDTASFLYDYCNDGAGLWYNEKTKVYTLVEY